VAVVAADSEAGMEEREALQLQAVAAADTLGAVQAEARLTEALLSFRSLLVEAAERLLQGWEEIVAQILCFLEQSQLLVRAAVAVAVRARLLRFP
jgi:hypothetical protein